MRYSNRPAYQRQREFLRRQFLQGGKKPFADVLSRECIDEALGTIEACWNDRIYTPLVTLWVFLGQVLECRSFLPRCRRSTGGAPRVTRFDSMFL